MEINRSIFETVKQHNAQLICVTKYWDEEVTKEVLDFGLSEYPENFLGVGENRLLGLSEKNLPREHTHFIGNLQSRNLKEIARNAAIIHSLCKFTHLQKLHDLCDVFRQPLEVFLQINISGEPQKGGILVEEFPAFFEAMDSVIDYDGFVVSGISAIGAGEFEISEKVAEFKKLKELRDRYLPGGKISAGTSRDYEIALGEGIDIVRVGRALIE